MGTILDDATVRSNKWLTIKPGIWLGMPSVLQAATSQKQSGAAAADGQPAKP